MRKIKFIDYTGRWPTLCFGVLTYSVDDVEFKVSSPYTSGGSVSFSDDYSESHIAHSEWQECENEDLQHLSKEEREELLRQFNLVVDYGCCGGCI